MITAAEYILHPYAYIKQPQALTWQTIHPTLMWNICGNIFYHDHINARLLTRQVTILPGSITQDEASYCLMSSSRMANADAVSKGQFQSVKMCTDSYIYVGYWLNYFQDIIAETPRSKEKCFPSVSNTCQYRKSCHNHTQCLYLYIFVRPIQTDHS